MRCPPQHERELGRALEHVRGARAKTQYGKDTEAGEHSSEAHKTSQDDRKEDPITHDSERAQAGHDDKADES
jgi:hypothetical protein